MSSKGISTLSAQELPEIPSLDTSSSVNATSPAVKQIQSDTDVITWQKSFAHQTIILFLARLCESAVGKGTRNWVKRDARESLENSGEEMLECVLEVLDEMQNWTKEIEPLKSPQRFGNLAFRSWGQRLEERSSALHNQLLPPRFHPSIAEMETYLLGGFGSWIRLDYGSGHELSFLAWLCFLARLGAFSDDDTKRIAPKVEERIALEVIPKYLQVVWGLQDRYGLEPAGSHGVWGLDDYQFIPYAIGAAQLRNQTIYQPSAISATNHKPETPKMPIDQLLQFIPGPSTVSSSRTSTSSGIPPFANLYTTSIARIHSLKRGPFSEHSPILYDVALTVPNWVKVHSGMMKMWEAECLGKRPVVQHFPFGDVAFVWEGEKKTSDADELTSGQQIRTTLPPMTGAPWKATGSTMPPTAVPWKDTSAMPATGAPWKDGGSNLPMTGAPWARSTTSTVSGSMASTGSAAAASSPFGIISRPSVPSRTPKE